MQNHKCGKECWNIASCCCCARNRHTPPTSSRLKEADLIVVEGTLYPLLTRLKKDGLLSYEWRESTQGPPRKYYALTLDGETFLAGLDCAWNELSATVGHLKSESPIRLPLQGKD